MIQPTEFSDTQNLGIEAGSGTTSTSSSSGPSSNLSNELGEPNQQAYTGVNVFHDKLLWDSLLDGDRVRPYIDLHLVPHANIVRLPITGTNYDVYADAATFYENVLIKGDVTVEGDFAGNLNLTGDLSYNKSIEVVTANKTLDISDRSKILHIEPSGASVTITLPSSGVDTGFFVEIVNAKEGAYTLIETASGTLKAKNPGLSQRYSAATAYWTGSDWFAIGDLTPI